MLRFGSKKSKNGGFSLAELLAVVAILGILAAIAIPSAVTIQRDLKLMELNDTARQIFITAQNQLTALRAANGLDAVKPDGDAEKVDTLDGMDNIYCTQSKAGAEDTQFAAMMPTGAIDSTILDGQQMAVIEYNPNSASVYAVFYAEADFDYALYNKYRDGEGDKEERRKIPLGYYGGDAAGIPSIDVIQNPKITLENGEELKLTIDYTDAIKEAANVSMDYADQAKSILKDLKYTVEIEQADKNENYIKVTTSGADDSAPIVFEGTDYIKGSLVLDSLTNPHFATLVQQGESFVIAPGADIIVKVTINYTDKENHQSVPVKWESQVENSLFESRGMDETTKKEVVKVSCGRHLQNLEERISGVSTTEGSEYSVTNVEQTAKIDWQPYIDNGATVTEYDLGNFGAGGTTPQKTFAPNAFISITNPTIQSFTGSEAGIHNLWINENDDSQSGDPVKPGYTTGLFGWLVADENYIELKTIYLVNPYAAGRDKGQIVGTLVGYAENVRLENCRAYLDENGIKNWKALTNARAYGAYAVNTPATHRVGGLIGMAKQVELTQCFAALTAVQSDESTGHAGGLIGQVIEGTRQTTINQCYADTLSLKGANVGGLMGEARRVTATNCYAIGQVLTAGGTAAGFSATFANCIAEDCYAAVTLNSESTENRKKLSGFASGIGAVFKRCYYVADAINGTIYPEKVEEGQPEPVSYEYLKNWTPFGKIGLWSGSDEKNTHEYNMQPFEKLGALKNKVDKELYSNEVYPFPHLAAFDHYGDWPLPAKRGALVYYEVYEGGETIGMSGVWADGTTFEGGHPLRNDAGVVVRDGYAYVGYAQAASLSVGGKNTITVVKDNILTNLLDMTDITVCPIKYEDLIGTALQSNSFYRQLSANGVKTKLYFNPNVAKAVVYQPGDKAPTIDGAASIRSARQLAALGKLGQTENYLLGLSFAQELDINFTKYDTEYAAGLALYPIGTFTGVYDGHNYTVTSAGLVSDADHVGLFGSSEGTLKNIVFRANALNDPITGGKQSVGALAGSNSGTIENCAVAGFAVSGEGAVGGLVGQNSGAITNSYADNASVSGGVSGGLIGLVSGENSVTSCHALGVVTGSSKTGGFIGSAQDDTNGTVKASYAACSFDGEADPFVGALGLTVENCFYLSDIAGGKTSQSAAQGKKHAELSVLAIEGAVELTKTVAYDQEGSYPFPVTNAVHYGNWPEKGENPPETQSMDLGIGVATKNENGERVYRLIGGKKQPDGTYKLVQGEDIPIKEWDSATVAILCISESADTTGLLYASWNATGNPQHINAMNEISSGLATSEVYKLKSTNNSLTNASNVVFYKKIKGQYVEMFTIYQKDWPQIMWW